MILEFVAVNSFLPPPPSQGCLEVRAPVGSADFLASRMEVRDVGTAGMSTYQVPVVVQVGQAG